MGGRIVIEAVLARFVFGNSEYDVDGLRLGIPVEGRACVGSSTGSGALGIEMVGNTAVGVGGFGLYP